MEEKERAALMLTIVLLRRHLVKPQRRKDFLRLREGQTAHYGRRKVLRCAAGKATLRNDILTVFLFERVAKWRGCGDSMR